MKFIHLSGTKTEAVKVSDDEYPLLSQHKWYNCMGYAHNVKMGFMHRVIKGNPKGMVVDHNNHDKLDNQNENLIIRTNVSNARNQPKHKDANNRFYGVYYDKNNKCFNVDFKYDGVRFNRQGYQTDIEAGQIYNWFIIENNFDDKPLNYLDDVLLIPVKPKDVSKYKAVRFKNGKYHATMRVGTIEVKILTSDNELECALAYDKYIVEHKMTTRFLNFPKNYPDFKEKVIKTFYEDVDDDTIRLMIRNKPDMIALIDRKDYDLVKYYTTYCDNHGYIIVQHGDKYEKLTRLHKFITDTGEEQDIDHDDRDKGNNKRSNLTFATSQQNGQNKTKQSNCSSDYYGVMVHKDCWGCKICIDYKSIWIGRYKIEEHAARARDLYIIKNVKNHKFPYNFKWDENDIDYWFDLLNLKNNKKFSTK